MKTTFLPLLLLLIVASGLVGCGSKTESVTQPNAQAVNDPNGRGRALLAEFDKVAPDDQQAWVQQRSLDFTVFQNVTDPDLKAQYEAKIRPLGGIAK